MATEISGNQSNQSNQCQKNNLWQDFAFFPPFPLPFRQYSVPLHPTLLENEALCFDLVARNLVNFNVTQDEDYNGLRLFRRGLVCIYIFVTGLPEPRVRDVEPFSSTFLLYITLYLKFTQWDCAESERIYPLNLNYSHKKTL